MVVWIIGLSGAGKTTLARETVRRVRRTLPNVVLLDGDQLREVWGGDVDHTLAGRKRNADRICRLGRMLEEQGVHVVCAILSLFEESRAWNRDQCDSYFEVFIDAPLEALQARDPKGLYAAAAAGRMADVPGVDLPFAPPQRPDKVIANTGGLDTLLEHAEDLAARIVQDDARRRKHGA